LTKSPAFSKNIQNIFNIFQMKKFTISTVSKTVFSLSIACLLFFACNKDLTTLEGNDWTELRPTRLDSNAGNWKPAVLITANNVSIPAPAATNSAAYQADLTELKSFSGKLTDAQKAAIQYWSVGGVLRWNQIMRELVAKRNLPPVYNADGSYPLPDQTSPFNYPEFPFANPPYAARAYAYVTVAQYDALIAANYYKQQFKRPAPYVIDPSISLSVTKSDLYAYPNEDAVVASVTLEMMKFLFPADVEYLNQKADEQRFFKLWAGAATRSDIVAGDSLGRAVAAKVLARARTDGMRNSIGNQSLWDSLAQTRKTLGETPWASLDAPVRPPMLPFYGKVKTWATDVVAVRPAAPPSTQSPEIKAQLAEVKEQVDNSTREKMAIVHFWADGVGTSTPPGHWNATATNLIKAANFSEVRTARAFALLNMAMMDAAISCWDTKTAYFYPRPTQLDPTIKTLTGIPNFPAYTSGHSTFSGAAAQVLGYIFPLENTNMQNQAEEASISRLYGGIHYRMDCTVGLGVGKTIGNNLVARGRTDGAE
jgi:PAP2 superfamily